jgi:hypothetical protein
MLIDADFIFIIDYAIAFFADSGDVSLLRCLYAAATRQRQQLRHFAMLSSPLLPARSMSSVLPLSWLFRFHISYAAFAIFAIIDLLFITTLLLFSPLLSILIFHYATLRH